MSGSQTVSPARPINFDAIERDLEASTMPTFEELMRDAVEYAAKLERASIDSGKEARARRCYAAELRTQIDELRALVRVAHTDLAASCAVRLGLLLGESHARWKWPLYRTVMEPKQQKASRAGVEARRPVVEARRATLRARVDGVRKTLPPDAGVADVAKRLAPRYGLTDDAMRKRIERAKKKGTKKR